MVSIHFKYFQTYKLCNKNEFIAILAQNFSLPDPVFCIHSEIKYLCIDLPWFIIEIKTDSVSFIPNN